MLIRRTRNRRLRELAQRRAGGLEVTLLWDERSDRLTVTVHDARTGEFFELGAPPDRALDVFYTRSSTRDGGPAARYAALGWCSAQSTRRSPSPSGASSSAQ
jgi:hypothetical protein